MSLFDDMGLPWGWFAGLLVFGLTATSCYTAARRAPRGQAGGVWRWCAISTVAAAACLVAIFIIAIAPVFSIATIAQR